MFIWDRTPPQEWVDDLASISPPTVGLSHAELWWEAGLPWAPAQRWVIYNLVPVEGMRSDAFWSLRTMLDGEGPCTCAMEWLPGDAAKGVSDCLRCGQSRTQGRQRIWRTFFDRGYWAQPMWVIQGNRGGHRTAYTDAERRTAAHMGMPSSPPETGALPYAGWDWRVKRNLLNLDMAGTAFANLRTERGFRRSLLERKARVAEMAYMQTTFDGIREETPVTAFDDLPIQHGARPVDLNTSTARFIETGVFA